MSLIERLFRLEDRVALVTGSSAGIGAAIAGGLAAAGAKVVVNGRSPDKIAAVVAAIAAAGGRAYGVPFDVTSSAAVRAGVARIEDEIGPIDILFNNAGIQRRGALEDYAEETWRELMRANLDSVFFVAQAVARAMNPRRRGQIVNICSVQSELGRPGIAPYAASKGAVKMLTKGMAIDWGKYGLASTAWDRVISARNSTGRWSRTRSSLRGSRSARRSAAGATSMNSSAPPFSSPPTPPASSTDISSTSTAASRPRSEARLAVVRAAGRGRRRRHVRGDPMPRHGLARIVPASKRGSRAAK